jgi:DNA-directed RNA polymerase specialized sigma24 family protein
MKNPAINPQHQELHQAATRKFNELVALKKQGDQGAFNEHLLKMLPEVEKFINRRLDAAIHKGHFPKSKYKAEDFLDQLFIEVYSTIGDVENEDDFYIWLFKKTNELLEKTIAEEEFEDSFFKNIDEYSTDEWKQMSEKFSAEADGDLIMREDLEDVSYHKSKHSLKHIFVEDNERALIEKLDRDLSEEDVGRFTNMVIQNFPQPMQMVFELFTKQNFTLLQISEIMQRNVNEVEELLNEARAILYNSLSAWHPEN